MFFSLQLIIECWVYFSILYSQTLLFILSAYNSLYLPTLNSHSIPVSLILPTGNHKSVLRVWESVSFCSVWFSHSVMSDSLRPYGLQHTRLPCPSPNPEFTHKLMSIELLIPSTHLILSCPLLLLPSIFLSTRVFSNESFLPIRWPKYWGFSFKYQSFQWTARTDLL